MEKNKLDLEKQSLLNQIADYAGRLAAAESKVAELYHELNGYREEEIKEMDKRGKIDVKK